MSLPFAQHFDAYLPNLVKPVRITSFYEAQVFMRRWVIRDKDPILKAVLSRMERPRSSEQIHIVFNEFKRTLATRGLLGPARS